MKRIVKLFFILSLFILISCKDNDLVSPLPTGTIVGYVYLSDGSPYKTNDNSNVNVALENTNFATITDSLGRWYFDNVPQGIYDIRFSKEGFGTTEKQGFQFVGNGTASAGIIYLQKLPTFSVFNVSDSTEGSQVVITFSVSDTELNQYVRYFVGRTTNVKAKTPFYTFESIIYIPNLKTTFSFTISQNELFYYGFKSGEKAYLKIYPANAGFPFSYRDIHTGAMIFPNLGENSSDVIEITVP